jgi:hypothetical protein
MEQHRTFLITPNGVINLDQVSCILTVDNGLTLELSPGGCA